MNISPVNFYHNNFFPKKNVLQKTSQLQSFAKTDTFCAKNSSLKTPYDLYNLGSFNLSFCKKMPSIDLLNLIGRDNFPNEIIYQQAEENALNGKILDLYNIHTAYFAQLLNCDTLEEAKAIYPEFSDVIDAAELNKYNPVKIFKKIERGELSGVTLENLSLKLLQNHYAKILGVNRKDEYFGLANKTILRLMSALNIKRMPRVYMTEAAKQNPESVKKHAIAHRIYYNTPEGRQAQSEKMLRVHAADPEMRIRIQEGRKRFFQHHPEYLEIYSQAGKEVSSEHMKKIAEEYPGLGRIFALKAQGVPLSEAQQTYLGSYYAQCIEMYPSMNADVGKRVRELFKERGIVTMTHRVSDDF